MNKTDDLSINLNTLDEKGVYEAFHVEGNEEEALTDSYFELYQLLGAEAMLKLYKHYHGDKIDCPMKLYRAEYVADLAKQSTERRQRANIARAARGTRSNSLRAFSRSARRRTRSKQITFKHFIVRYH